MPQSGQSFPPEVAAILERLLKLLEDDNEQNNTLPEPHRSQIVRGIDCDELPRAIGEFGRTVSNPVPTNGPLGEVIYLSRLRTENGTPVMFHRVRAEDGAAGAVDVYEVLSLDGRVREILFLSMYHPRKSRKTPRGYRFAAKLDTDNFTYGVNHTVGNFPKKLDAYIRKWQMEMLGIPLPVKRVREAINGSPYHPSVLDEAESADGSSPEGRMRDDVLKLMHASQDPRFKGKNIAVGTDGLIRPVESLSSNPRIFEIVPTVSSTCLADGTVERDDTVMYVLADEAEAALDVILKPYDGSGGWYLDGMRVKSPGPWAYVCLRQEYDIADYVFGQCSNIANAEECSFTFYDKRVDHKRPGFVPKVGCFVFFTKRAVEASCEAPAFP